jgi:hypothetical protein
VNFGVDRMDVGGLSTKEVSVVLQGETSTTHRQQRRRRGGEVAAIQKRSLGIKRVRFYLKQEPSATAHHAAAATTA